MRRTFAALTAAALLAGCGSSPGNTIELTISGAGPKRSVLVTEEGQGSCNGGKLRQVPSADVLTAREVARDLKKVTQGGNAGFGEAELRPGGKAKPQRIFTAKTIDGTVQWAELHKPLPPELGRAELLALKLTGQLCPGK